MQELTEGDTANGARFVPEARTGDDGSPGSAGRLGATFAALAAAVADTSAAADLLAPGADLGTTDRARPNEWAPVVPRWRARYTRLLVACDGLAASSALAVAVRLSPSVPTWLVGPFTLAVLAALTANRVYEHRFLGHGTDEFRRLWTAAAYLLGAVALGAYAAELTAIRALVVVGLPLATLGLLGVHGIARALLYRMRRRGRCVQRVVAIGAERAVAELVTATRIDRHAGLDVVAACLTRSRGDDRPFEESVEGVPVLGGPDQTLRALRTVRADAVVLTAWSEVSQEELRRIAWDLEGSGTQLLVAPRLAEVSAPRMHIRTVHGQPLLNVEQPVLSGFRRVAKGCLDYALTVPGVALLSPVLLVLALAVRFSSPGPVLFRQERAGKNDTPFRMTKFRSMYLDAEQRLTQVEHLNEGGGPLFKMRDDPRVTPVGRVLRRFSLDELPQLFDVLAGRMSLVGPRPPLPREVSRYEEDVRRRLLVRPGITGLWQVSGRSDLTWEESVRLDLSYVDNWSPLLDVTIILRTIRAVLGRSGAY